jgi:hypothetical protein
VGPGASDKFSKKKLARGATGNFQKGHGPRGATRNDQNGYGCVKIFTFDCFNASRVDLVDRLARTLKMFSL